jgi:hypothetical protein
VSFGRSDATLSRHGHSSDLTRASRRLVLRKSRSIMHAAEMPAS